MSEERPLEYFDAVVVGGGPAGATAAHELATAGHTVLMLERGGRIKPCGGAIPPRLLSDFAIPDHLLSARVSGAHIVSPAGQRVHMPIDGGYVGMVDREDFDDWLRQRAIGAGAVSRQGVFQSTAPAAGGATIVTYRPGGGERGPAVSVRARAVIGADGANSAVARSAMPNAKEVPFVFAYHEVIESPAAGAFDGTRCNVHYKGTVSPDFYGWVFPHGATTSVGTGSARKGFPLRVAVEALRREAHLDRCATIRREGAPIPLKPRRRWDDGRSVVLAGDAAGAVAPASGEGIYYAMTGGRLAAEAVAEFLRTGDARALAEPRRRFMRAHGRVFWVLGLMQYFFYRNDRRRERFVSMCKNKDVQRIVWESYMNKALVRTRPAAHMRILAKDIAHLFGLVAPR